MKALRERFPALAPLVEAASAACPEADGEYSLEAGGNAVPALRARGRLVHSLRDPVREGRRLAEGAVGSGPVVILGFGLGYACDSFVHTDRPLVIAEKDARVLALAFGVRNLVGLLLRDNLAFVVGGPPSAVLSALETFPGVPSVIVNRALRETDPDWYDAAAAALRLRRAKDEINAATLRKFGKLWVRNLSANLDAIRDLNGIVRLDAVAAGFPILVVAAGPSLDQVLPLLPALARRCVVVAVDTALRAVLASGIDPDFVLVIDPQYWNFRHLDRCVAPRSILVTESAVYPPVFGAPFARAFLCSSQFPLGRFVEDRVEPKGELGAGGSVATTAWDFARRLGASSIWMAGLDLAFPGLKTHFRGAFFEERVHAESRRLVPAETRSFHALRDGMPFLAADASGGRVLSDRRLSLYAAWFEARFDRFPRMRTLGLSPHGLRIQGLELADAADAMALPERREEWDAVLTDALARIDEEDRLGNPAESRAARYAAARALLADGLAALARTAREGERIARGALERKLPEADAAAALRALDAVFAEVELSEVKDVVGFLFPGPEELEEGLRTKADDKITRHLEYSAAMCARLAEAAEYHAALLGGRALLGGCALLGGRALLSGRAAPHAGR